jgi:hypothetical protein
VRVRAESFQKRNERLARAKQKFKNPEFSLKSLFEKYFSAMYACSLSSKTVFFHTTNRS